MSDERECTGPHTSVWDCPKCRAEIEAKAIHGKRGEADGRGERHDSPDVAEPRSDPLVPLLEQQIRDGVGIFRKDTPGPSEDVVERLKELRNGIISLRQMGDLGAITEYGDVATLNDALSEITRLRAEVERLEKQVASYKGQITKLKGLGRSWGDIISDG